MKQLMKTNKSGVMKIPDKGKIDFGEMLLREQLFKKGIEPGMIKNEKQLDNILDTPVVPKSERVKPKKSGKVIKVDFDKGRWNKASGGKAKESWTDKLTRWGGGPSMVAGELGIEGLNQIYQLLNMPGLYNKGGRAGIGYLLAEDTNERTPYAGGGSGKPPISGGANFNFKTNQGSEFPQPGLTVNQGGYSGNLGGNINLPLGQGNIGLEGALGFGRNKYNVDYKGHDVASGVGETKLGDVWNIGAKYQRPLWGGDISLSGSLDQNSNKQGNISWRKKFAGGGMGRRAFLKLMAAVGATGAAAKYGLASLLKGGAKKKVVQELTSVPIKNIKGMPLWFKPLVNKVIKEGEQVKVTEYDRLITHKTKLPNSKTDVYVNQDLNNGNVWVDIGVEKHGFPDGKYGQPVRLEYKAKELIEPDVSKTGKVKSKGGKTQEEFNVEEAEFTGGHPENVKFEETTIEKFGDHASDFSEVEKFAIGKNTVKSQFGTFNPTKIKKASGGLTTMLGE